MNGAGTLLNVPLADALSLTVLGAANKADNVTVNVTGIDGTGLPGGIIVNGGAGSGVDTLTVRGTSGDDTLAIGPEAVIVTSATGAVQVPFSGFERLRLDGMAGNDTYAIPALPLPTTIVDVRGNDTLDFSQATTGVNVNLGRAAPQRIFGGTVPLTLLGVPIENVIGTAFNDTITGNSRANRIFGGDGDDVLNGAGGNDLVFGGLGNDTILGGAGNNVLLGGDGNDILRAGAGRNVLIGGLGADDLRGGSNSDLLIGGTTTFDESDGGLLAILAEWSAQRSIDLRIANLIQGLGPGLSPFLRMDESVLNDNDATDTLFGGLGGDWFLSFPSDNVLDRGPTDRPVV
jgi:Ca2+-binding RTX toxin-like protein